MRFLRNDGTQAVFYLRPEMKYSHFILILRAKVFA